MVLLLLAITMATINWSFDALSFCVTVSAPSGSSSTVAGHMGAEELNLRISPIGNHPRTTVIRGPTTTAIGTNAGVEEAKVTVQTPVEVELNLSFADDGLLRATYEITSHQVSGKGVGKGLGRDVTIVPATMSPTP